MTPEQIGALSRYNRWINERLYETCGRLDDEARKRDLGAFFGSIHGTLNHIMLGDFGWMYRFTRDAERFTPRGPDGAPIAITGLDTELFADFETLAAARARLDGAIGEWARGLTPADLDRDIVYRVTTGEKYRHPLWYAVAHFFNHQTHHRGQVTTLLMQLGHDPGVTDLLALLQQGHRIE